MKRFYVIGFLVLRHQFGERFDEFPAVRKFLSRSDLPPDNRIQLMMLTLPLGIWEMWSREGRRKGFRLQR